MKKLEESDIQMKETIEKLITQSKYKLALELLKTRTKEKTYEYYLLRSRLYFYLKEFYFSLKDAEKCISITQNNIEPYQISAKCNIEMYNIEQSRNYLIQAEKISPNNKTNSQISKALNAKVEKIKEQMQKFPIYPKCLKFLMHLYSKGTFINKLQIFFHSNSYRSVLATDNIKTDEIILKVPNELLLTLEVAQESEIGKYITTDVKKILNSPNHCLLTSYILSELEKGYNSQWAFYFDMLPESYDSFPIFYKENELKLLEGTAFYDTIQIKKKEMKQDYSILCSIIENYNKFNYESFCRVRMVVASRIFGVKINGRKTDILAPFADMLNHKRPRETHWSYEDSENAFVMSALRDIPKGLEVFDSYGKKCNSRFLLNYGFAIDNNEDNEYKIIITMTPDIPNFNEKCKLLKSNIIKKFSIKKDLRDAQTYLFFSFLRFTMYDGSLNIFKDIVNKYEIRIQPISIKNEIMVMKRMRDIMKELMGKWKGSLEDDYAILRDKECSLSFNEKNCYLMKISEKEVIKFYYDFSEYAIQVLEESKVKGDIGNGAEDKKNPENEMYESFIKEISGELVGKVA